MNPQTKVIVKDPESFEDADIYLLSTIGSILHLYSAPGKASKYTQVYIPKITCTAAELVYPDLLSVYLDKKLCVTILGYEQVYHNKALSISAKPLYTSLNKTKSNSNHHGVLRHHEAPFGDVSWFINDAPFSNYEKDDKIFDNVPVSGIFHISLKLTPSYYITHELISLLISFVGKGFHVYIPKTLDKILHFLHNAEVLDSSPQVCSMPAEPSKDEKKSFDDNEIKVKIFTELQKKIPHHYGDVRTWPDWEFLGLDQMDDYIREPMPKQSLVHIYDRLYSLQHIDSIASQTKVIILTLNGTVDAELIEKLQIRNVVTMNSPEKVGAAQRVRREIALIDEDAVNLIKIKIQLDNLVTILQSIDPFLVHEATFSRIKSSKFLVFYEGERELVPVTKILCDEFSTDIFSSTNTTIHEEEKIIVSGIRFFCSDLQIASKISKILRCSTENE